MGQKLLHVPEGDRKGQTQLCHWHMFHLGSKAVLAAERREIEAELNDNEGEERNPTRSDAFGYVSSRLPIFFAGFLMMGREKSLFFRLSSLQRSLLSLALFVRQNRKRELTEISDSGQWGPENLSSL